MSRPETRTAEQLREQYDVERELADRLRRASKKDRRELYRTCYDELFRRVPHHRQLSKKADEDVWSVYRNVLDLLLPLAESDSRFLEIGAGDCKVALEMARRLDFVYAVDVSKEIVDGLDLPSNFELILSDGCSVPVPPESVDLVLSNQLMEHVHPDDVMPQLEGLHHALKPGGKFLCMTPHRFSGPHDISKHFDTVATGFHLHEYTSRELSGLLRRAGFSKVRQIAASRGRSMALSIVPAIVLESLIGALPAGVRRRLCRGRLLGILFERLILLAEK